MPNCADSYIPEYMVTPGNMFSSAKLTNSKPQRIIKYVLVTKAYTHTEGCLSEITVASFDNSFNTWKITRRYLFIFIALV